VKDDFGTTMQNVRDKVDAKLNDTTAAELAKRRIEYDTGFTLLPGKYVIKFLARDDETGRIGTYQSKFTIPNLNKEEKRIPISSVVLSSQRDDIKDALYNASKENRTRATSPTRWCRRAEADSQRDAGVQQEPDMYVYPAGLRARPRQHAASGGVRDLLPRADERRSKRRRCR
jgi:hypothetical protein